ncbi:endonuclease domain-containing protein [Phyllobacterium sp. 22229]|uniref:endonuclease domain-containing protein n=1 Tax=Phyllobacterium sp. 22229 TaxID=3453895 RepID=UPI003F83170D
MQQEGKPDIRREIPLQIRKFARDMRKDATLPENMLWQAIRNKRLNGLKFKRQLPFDRYILDFVCFEARLIIEIDGSQHSCSQLDKQRDAYFHQRGFKTVRFWNDEILTNLDGACAHILREAEERLIE